jgi:iron(III) transport system substrate-binding protein
MRRLSHLARGVGMLAATILLAACGGAAEPSAETVPIPAALEPVYDQAKNEPVLTWYSAQEPALNEAVVEAFTRQYPGVEVESLRLASGPLGVRYAQERAAGAVTAGLVTLADPNFVDQGLGSGWFEPVDRAALPNLSRLPERFFADGVATTGVNVLGIGYNTDEVQNPPRTWEDALAPEYAGRILLGDPRNVPSYVALTRVLTEKVAPDYLERLTAQRPTVVDSMVPGTQQLAAGEAALAFPDVLSVTKPLADKGAPIDFVVPEPTTGVEFATMMSAGAASPNTARLLYDFLFSDAGQEAFNASTGASPIGAIGQTAALPAGYVDPAIRELPAVRADLLARLGLG